MTFTRELLPDAICYFESQGLKLDGRGKWRTTRCDFHDGSDSMRINTASGGWVCMSCGVKGGDVLAYEMQFYGLEFVDAAKALGCWTDDGVASTYKPCPVSARTMLEVLGLEVQIVALIAVDLSNGKTIPTVDKDRLLVAAGRINNIASEVLNG
jgi:hypothetical protein